MRRSAMRVLLMYQPVMLVFGSLLSAAPAASASVILVVLYVASLMAGWWPGFLVAALASSVVLPVLLVPHLGYWSVLLALPVTGAVVHGLERMAPVLMGMQPPSRRVLSPLASSMGVALAAIVLLAMVLSSPALALTGGLLILMLSAGAAIQYVRLGPRPLVVEQQELSARAGERIDISVETRAERRGAGGFVRLATDDGVAVKDAGPFPLEERLNTVVSLTPLLGGPSDVMLRASVTDALGLIHLGQSMDVADMNVIPRARVARWAAEEFLEHRGGGLESGRTLSGQVAGFLAGQTGVEYLSSRVYVPGDSLLAIDWKHTSRLQVLVVKTFDDGSKPPGLLLVNLSATGADEADRLVYEFLSAALTIAAMSYGASVAVYDHKGDRGTTPVVWGRELVRAALDACVDVRIAPAWRRVLRPVSLQELQGRVARVRRVGGEVAPRLASLLGLKEQALRVHLEGEPLGTLLRGSEQRYHPTWCVAISAMHGDAEAVLTGLRRMERSGIRTKLVNVGVEAPRAR